MRSFASDNNSGVHPLVMEALNRANRDHAVGYGDDVWTEEAVRKIREAFTPDCEPLFVFNGTGSNAVALQLCTRPYNSIICAETAHIYVDECGAPARMTGCQIRPVATPDGKLTPELVRPYLCHFGEQHHSQPVAGAHGAQQRRPVEKQEGKEGVAKENQNIDAVGGEHCSQNDAGNQDAGQHADDAQNHLGAKPAALGNGETAQPIAQPGIVEVAQQQLGQQGGI